MRGGGAAAAVFSFVPFFLPFLLSMERRRSFSFFTLEKRTGRDVPFTTPRLSPQTLDFRHKKVALDRKTAKLTLVNRLVMWLGVSALYLALFIPTWSLASSAPARKPRAGPDALPAAGVAASLLGLWLEVTADVVKAHDKGRDPAGFSRGCVYRLCRQPNLLGEALFWWGSAAAGAPALLAAARAGGEGARAAAALALAATAGVAAITAILVGDSRKKTRDQEGRMRGKSGWSEFAARTPPLWPLPRRGGA